MNGTVENMFKWKPLHTIDVLLVNMMYVLSHIYRLCHWQDTDPHLNLSIMCRDEGVLTNLSEGTYTLVCGEGSVVKGVW